MEPLKPDLRLLLTKLPYMSYLMQYYGCYFGSAALFKSLCKESREEWNSNLKAISNTIMCNKNNKARMILKNPGKIDIEKQLLKNHLYLNFRFEIYLESVKDCVNINELLKAIDAIPSNLIVKVYFTATEENVKIIDKVFKTLISLNLMENGRIKRKND